MKTVILMFVLIPLLTFPLCAYGCSGSENCDYAAEGTSAPFDNDLPPQIEIKPKRRGFADAVDEQGGGDVAGQSSVQQGVEPLEPGHHDNEEEGSSN